MTLLELLTKAAGGATGLVALLRQAATQAPDLAPQLEEWISRLEGAVSSSNLVALASALPAEIANIAAGRLDPRDHPSDGI